MKNLQFYFLLYVHQLWNSESSSTICFYYEDTKDHRKFPKHNVDIETTENITDDKDEENPLLG